MLVHASSAHRSAHITQEILFTWAPHLGASRTVTAAEVCETLLHLLSWDLDANKSLQPPSDVETVDHDPRQPEAISAEFEWHRRLAQQDSAVNHLFQSLTRTKSSCLTCGFSVVTFTAITTLTVPAYQPMQSHLDLTDCFNLLLSARTQNMWECANCRRPRTASTWTTLSRLPDHLVIQLEQDDVDSRVPVDFPLEDMDLSDLLPDVPAGARIEDRRSRAVYGLYAIINAQPVQYDGTSRARSATHSCESSSGSQVAARARSCPRLYQEARSPSDLFMQTRRWYFAARNGS